MLRVKAIKREIRFSRRQLNSDIKGRKHRHWQESAQKLIEAKERDKSILRQFGRDATTRKRIAALFGSSALGVVVGIIFLSLLTPWFALVAGIIGFVTSILSLGTSGLFQPNKQLHYSTGTQRAIAYVAGFSMGIALPGLIP